MKKLLYLACLFFSFNSFAQQTDANTALLAPYLQFPKLPPFTITRLPDSTKFGRDDLKNGKATLMISFSPDCEHCQLAIKELTENMKPFKKVQIVMTTPLEYRFIKTFYEKNELSKFKNIIMGRDPIHFLGSFYQLQFVPSAFLYNKKGDFVKEFRQHFTMAEIIPYL